MAKDPFEGFSLEQKRTALAAQLSQIRERQELLRSIREHGQLSIGAAKAGVLSMGDLNYALDATRPVMTSLDNPGQTGELDLYEIDRRFRRVSEVGLRRHAAVKAGQSVGFFQEASKTAAFSISNAVAGLGELAEFFAEDVPRSMFDRPMAALGHSEARTRIGQGRGTHDSFIERGKRDAAVEALIASKGKDNKDPVVFSDQDLKPFLNHSLPGNRSVADPGRSSVAKRIETGPSAFAYSRAAQHLHSRLMVAFGLPENPTERDLYMQEFGGAGRFVGEMSAVIAMIVLSGRAGLSGAAGARTGARSALGREGARVFGNPAAVGESTSAVANLLARVPTGKQAAAGIGGGAAIGYTTSVLTAPDDTDAWGHMDSALRGAAMGYLFMGLAFGRPWGLQHHSVHHAALRGEMGSVERLGRAIFGAPRITAGHMLQSGAVGAGLTTAQFRARGADPQTAVQEGLKEGTRWMAGDLTFSKLGAAARWTGYITDIERTLAANAQRLGLSGKAAFTAGQVGQQLFNVGTGATLGASIAAAKGEDKTSAAIAGGIASGVGFRILQRYQSLLPERTVLALKNSVLGKLTPDELGEISQVMLRDAATDSAQRMDLDIFQKRMVNWALGRFPDNKKELEAVFGLQKNLLHLYQEANKLAPGQQLPLNDGPKMVQLVNLARRAMEIRTLIARRFATMGDDAKKAASVGVAENEAVAAARKNLAIAGKEGEAAIKNAKARRIVTRTTKLNATEIERLIDDEIFGDGFARNIPGKLGSTQFRRDLERFFFGAPGERQRAIPGSIRRTFQDRIVEGVPAAKRVGPAHSRAQASLLPDSITPQEVTRPPKFYSKIKEWSSRHGLNFFSEQTPQGRRFVFAHKNHRRIVEARTIREAVSELYQVAKLKADDSSEAAILGMPKLPQALKGQGGFVDPTTLTTTAGALSGAFSGTIAGSMIQHYLVHPEGSTESTYHGGIIGAVMGAFAGAVAGARFGGWVMNRTGKQLVQFWAPPVHQELGAGKVSSLLGKDRTTRMQFFRFPVDKQVDHVKQVLRTVINRKNVPIKTKRDRKRASANFPTDSRQQQFLTALRKYTPTHLTPQLYDELQQEVYNLARQVGFSGEEAAGVWRGMLVNMATPFATRLRRGNPPNLLTLAKEAGSIFGGVEALENLRTVVTSAKVFRGTPIAVPEKSVQAARASVEKLLTPESRILKKLIAIADRSDFDNRARDAQIETMSRGIMPHFLRPPEMFRSLAEKLSNIPETVGLAKDIRSAHDSLMIATERILVDTTEGYKRLNNIFAGLPLREDRLLVRRALEDDTFLLQMQSKNQNVYEAALSLRNLFDEYAELMGLEPGQKIQNYFPWIYSTRTLEELKKSGVVPSDIVVPVGSGVPEYKIMRHMLNRKNNVPLGETLEDPLEVAQIYINGAVRKIHLDRVAAIYDDKFYTRLAEAQPFVASELAKWQLAVFGIPTSGQIRSQALLRNIGVNLETISAALGFNSQEFAGAVIDRYFLGAGAPGRFSRFVRSGEFYTKLAGQFISPIINLTQLANTMLEVGTANTFIGGITFSTSAMQGLAAETLEDAGKKLKSKDITRMAGFIDPQLKGKAKLALGRDIGVWSDNTRRVLDQLNDQLAREEGRSVGTIAGGAIVGGVAGVALGDEDSTQANFLKGAAVGTTGAVVAPKVIRTALQKARDIAIFPFSAAEAINRSFTAGGAQRAFRQTTEIRAGQRSAASVAAVEAAELTTIGALGGGGAAAVRAEEGERGDAFLKGAAVGAAAGAGAATLSRNRGRTYRISKDLDFLETNASMLPGLRQNIFAQGPPTLKEVEKVYMRQVLDMTQFRFGREGRPEALRTTMGEIAGALQSFTLNQFEFAGARLQSFIKSMANEGGVRAGTALTGGNLDTRIFQHLAILAGMGAALQTMAIGLEWDTDPDYWLGRMGMALMPLLAYNRDAERWQVNDLGSHLTGPFINDAYQATQTFWYLTFDPKARAEWDANIDSLARKIISAMKQVETYPVTMGKAFEAAGAEGMADMIRSRQQNIIRATHPAASLRGNLPGQRLSGSGGDSGGLGGGGGGLDSGGLDSGGLDTGGF